MFFSVCNSIKKFQEFINKRDEILKYEVDDFEKYQLIFSKKMITITHEEHELPESTIDNKTMHDIDVNNELFENTIVWNVDELYCEILYEIVNNIGFESEQIKSLLVYIQDAFKIPVDKHEQYLRNIRNKDPPEILLNVEIINAKELVAKDANGLCDPFVTIFLASNSTHRYNTSVKKATLNPVWEEHFALPIAELKFEDTLCVEIWDFDPAETVREKVGKFFDVKNIRGLRKLVKEIAITATTGQHNNELVGRCFIPLKSVHSSGLTMWFNLNKKNKSAKQGLIKLKLHFCSEKNIKVAVQEYKYLLRIFSLHELESSQVKEYWWCENFSNEAESILKHHCVQSNLSDFDIELSKWTVFCSIHIEYPLSFTLFVALQTKLIKQLNSTTTSTIDDQKQFWDSTRKLLPSVISVIRKIRTIKFQEDKNSLATVTNVLRILSNCQKINSLCNYETDLVATFGSQHRECTNLKELLISIIKNETIEWFETNVHKNFINKIAVEKLVHMIELIKTIKVNLQIAIELLDNIFLDKVLYVLYDERISKFIESEVINITKFLKTFRHSGHEISEQRIELGTTLFELYLILQKFSMLGIGLCPDDYENFYTQQFNEWFHECVTEWLDIAVFKAFRHIEKAVELDHLESLDSNSKCSSSAVDTLSIFYQVKIFWQQLNWPNIEDCYTFIAKIIDDICRCCVLYADRMVIKLNEMETDKKFCVDNKFIITTEWCLAINNIDYVRQSLTPFLTELNMESIIDKLSQVRSQIEADRCRQTLVTVVENSIDTVRNKIIDLTDTLIQKMCPCMNRFLIEGAELLHQNCNSVDRLMFYLDTNLSTLHEYLNDDNFNRVLAIIWDYLGDMVTKILDTNIEKRRPPSFYHNLHEALKVMVESFRQESSENDILQKIEPFLINNGLETPELIHKIYLERWKDQLNLKETPYGFLTVRVYYDKEDILIVNVMNAKNLIEMDSNRQCDPYVKVCLSPEYKFPHISNVRTQTQYKTLFPLFDEVFKFELTKDQKELKDGLIMFTVKDKDMFLLKNQYIGDAFILLSEIESKSVKTAQQIVLPLTRPEGHSEYLAILEHRVGDKVAKEFLKKYKCKT